MNIFLNGYVSVLINPSTLTVTMNRINNASEQFNELGWILIPFYYHYRNLIRRQTAIVFPLSRTHLALSRIHWNSDDKCSMAKLMQFASIWFSA